MQDAHRADCQKQHRIVAHYLAIQAWRRQLDCILFDRLGMEGLFGLKRFKKVRINWFEKDVKPWFPFTTVLRSNGLSTFDSVLMSRVDLSRRFPDGRMTNFDRIDQLNKNGVKTGRVDQMPALQEIVTYLAILADGLGEPNFNYLVSPSPAQL